MKTQIQQIKAVIYATRIYLIGLLHGQHVDWYIVYQRRLAFYEVFDWD